METTIIKYFCRFEPVVVDNFSEKAVKQHCHELMSFESLAGHFDLLEKSYLTKDKKRADIIICVSPRFARKYLNNVIEISVYHRLSNRLFSKKATGGYYSFCMTVVTDRGVDLYDYKSKNIAEVKRIFFEYIMNQRPPKFEDWKVIDF